MDSKFNKKEKFVIGAVEKYLFFPTNSLHNIYIYIYMYMVYMLVSVHGCRRNRHKGLRTSVLLLNNQSI